jgi:hypothetical protein
MDLSIVSRDMIREKARAAHARGAGRDQHGFNWFCTAVISTWQHEWDLCEAEKAGQQLAEACPP